MTTQTQNTQEHLARVSELIKQTQFAMVTHLDEQGDLLSCPMTTQGFTEFSGVIWFIGSKSSGLVESLAKQPKVNVSYAGNQSKNYVSLSGKALLIEDQQQLERMWSPFYQVYFTSPDDPDIQLIQVQVHSLEYWISNNALINLYQMGKAIIAGDKANLGERHKIEL